MGKNKNRNKFKPSVTPKTGNTASAPVLPSIPSVPKGTTAAAPTPPAPKVPKVAPPVHNGVVIEKMDNFVKVLLTEDETIILAHKASVPKLPEVGDLIFIEEFGTFKGQKTVTQFKKVGEDQKKKEIWEWLMANPKYTLMPLSSYVLEGTPKGTPDVIGITADKVILLQE